MSIQQNSQSAFRRLSFLRSGLFLLVAFAVLLPSARPARAALTDNLSGSAALSGVQSETDDDTRRTLRQELSANWFRNLSQYLTLRGALHYYKFTFDRSEQTGLFRKEWQPSGRLIWNHPAVMIALGGRQRLAEGTAASDRLTTDNFDVNLRTRLGRLPLLSIRYDWNHLRGEPGVAGRNILDRRLDIRLDYYKNPVTASYKITRSDTDNRVTGLETDQTHHLLRMAYTATSQAQGKLRLATDYTFSYQTQTDRLPTDETLLHTVDVYAGLYGDREAPDVGQLQTIPALNDGNRADPVQPPIDIGTGMSNRHLGADFGVPRQISALYIYTNKISDEQMTWQVYISDDNFTWEPYALNPAVRFDASVLRYEVLFPTVLSRYIKAVNSGFNQEEQVFVTEIQAVTEVTSSGELSQSSSSHAANLGGTYKINERLTATADLSYQRDPSVGLRGSRDNLHHSGSLRMEQSSSITHAVRWQFSLQNTHGEVADLRDNSLLYSFEYTPLPTIDLGWSVTGRRSYADSKRESDDLRFNGQATGTPLDGLQITGELGFGRGHRHLLDRTTKTNTRRITIDARATRWLETTASYWHQLSKIEQTDVRLLRDQYSVSVRFRPTRKISMRGQWDWSHGSARYLAKEFGANWNLSTAISTGFLYRLSDNDDGYRSERYSVRLNCRVSGRSSAYVSYMDNDFSRAAGSRTKSVQVGVRTGF